MKNSVGVFHSSIDGKAKRQLYRHHFSSFFKLVACKNLKFKTPKNFKHLKFKNSKDNSIVILVQLSLLSPKFHYYLPVLLWSDGSNVWKHRTWNLTLTLFLDFFGLVCPFRVQVKTTLQFFMQFSVVKASNWYWPFSVFNCPLLSKEFANTDNDTGYEIREPGANWENPLLSSCWGVFLRTKFPMWIFKIGGRFSLFQDVGYQRPKDCWLFTV